MGVGAGLDVCETGSDDDALQSFLEPAKPRQRPRARLPLRSTTIRHHLTHVCTISLHICMVELIVNCHLILGDTVAIAQPTISNRALIDSQAHVLPARALWTAEPVMEGV